MHLQVVQIVTFIVAFALAATRVLTASKLFWNLFPAWLAGIFPGLVVAIPALGQAVAGAQSWTDLTVAFLTAGALLLPGAHSHSVGSDKPSNSAKPPSFPPLAAAGLFLICLVLGGCSLFGSSGSVWPTVAKCAPSPQNVINSATQVLLGGGDYETHLEQLGEQYGMNVVVCVVDDIVKQWGSPTAKLTAETVDAKGRGQAFLARVGTKVER